MNRHTAVTFFIAETGCTVVCVTKMNSMKGVQVPPETTTTFIITHQPKVFSDVLRTGIREI